MVHCPVSELLEVITKVGVITTAVAKPWVCTERTAMPLLNITNKLGVGSTWLRHQRMTTGCTERKLCLY